MFTKQTKNPQIFYKTQKKMTNNFQRETAKYTEVN